MRVVVSGATGFAGRWLVRELEQAGHVALAMPPSSALDVTDTPAVSAFVNETRPDAVAHLAGVAFGPDARREPDRAIAINEGGTRAVLTAAASLAPTPGVLVVSSSEVYGHPDPGDLPLAEDAQLRAEHPYARSKLAQEDAAAEARRAGLRVVVVRPFNHAGPGQRPEFVVPAVARRVVEAIRAGRDEIPAGNVDVRRDFCDVRDVVRAYRLILETLSDDGLPRRPVYNVATGRSTAIRTLIDTFAAFAGADIGIVVDPALVRADDPPDIRGDASALRAELGWEPRIRLETTLRDVFDEAQRAASVGATLR